MKGVYPTEKVDPGGFIATAQPQVRKYQYTQKGTG